MEVSRLHEIERLLDADIQEDLPEEVEAQVRRLLAEGERRLITLYADITPEGVYGDRWFLATDRRLAAVAADDGSVRLEVDLPLEQVRRVRLRDFIGSGSLEAVTDGEAVELVRFSRTIAPQISRAYHILRRLAADEEASGERGKDRSGRHGGRALRCQTCGRALPHWSEVCPFCMERGKLLRRLIGYLEPYKAIAITGFLLTAIFSLLQLLPAYITRSLIDDVITPRNFSRLLPILLVLGAIYLGRALIGVVRGYMMEWIGARVVFDMRVHV
ncbi:MAG TPA: hypothetical protein VMY87_04430 [Armatimonadota bacterium]|nr:hypothetical protein [Armatimonadota bacterium]